MADLVLYTDTLLDDPVAAKTAHAMLRFAPDRVRAVFDRRFAGSQVSDCCPQFPGLDIPIFGHVGELVASDRVVIGLAPVGGDLTGEQRRFLTAVLGQGLHVINGLHERLGPPDQVTNLRSFDPSESWIAQGIRFSGTRVLTVGTCYSIGKMTTTVILAEALKRSGRRAAWVATGQTGVLLSGGGRVLDAIPLDFVKGHIERLVQDAEQEADYVVIEGQGAIFHPGFSTLVPALIHAAAPQHLVLCHRLGQTTFGAFSLPLPSVTRAVEAHTMLGAALGVSTRVSAVALDSSHVSAEEYAVERDRITRDTGLPCCDPVREGPGALLAAVLR